MKVLVITLLSFTIGASSAFAQKNGGDKADRQALLKHIAELKALVAKLQDQTAAERAKAEKIILVQRQRAEEERKRAFAEAQRQRAIAEKHLAAAHKAALFKDGPKGFHKDGPPAELRAAIERLENLRVAVKHLQAAGMKDLAAEAAKRAEKMQDALKQFKHHAKGHHEPGHKGGPKHLHDPGHAIMQLQKQVQELQKAVERLERRK